MDFGAIHLFDGASVNGEQVEGVLGKNGQQFREDLGRVESDAGFDGKSGFDGIAQGAEDRIDALRFAKEAATGAFAIDDRRRSTEVEVHGGDGILLQLARGANQRRNIIADHLRDDRFAGAVFSD